MLFLGPGGEDICDTRIKSASKQCGYAAILKSLMVGPLPFVTEIRILWRLIVGSVEIVDSGFETGVHDMEILIWESHIDDNIRLELPDEFYQLEDIVGIYLGSLDFPFDLRSDFPALLNCPAGQAYFAENIRNLCTFMGDNLSDPAGPDYKNFGHYILHLSIKIRFRRI
jgi:hypothetical protein